MKKTFFAFCLALLSAPFASADTLVVGIEDQQFLPHYTVGSGRFTGYAADVLLLFMKSSTHKLKIKTMSSLELLKKMQSGEIDLRYPDNAKWQSSLKAKDSQTIYYSDNVVRYDEGSLVIKEKALAGVDQIRSVGIVRGREPVAYLKLLNSGKVLAKENPDLESLIKSTLLGRVDAAYCNVDVALYRLKTMGIGNDLLVNTQLPNISDYYTLSTIRHKDVIQEFNQFLQQNQAAIEELKRKYNLR